MGSELGNRLQGLSHGRGRLPGLQAGGHETRAGSRSGQQSFRSKGRKLEGHTALPGSLRDWKGALGQVLGGDPFRFRGKTTTDQISRLGVSPPLLPVLSKELRTWNSSPTPHPLPEVICRHLEAPNCAAYMGTETR